MSIQPEVLAKYPVTFFFGVGLSSKSTMAQQNFEDLEGRMQIAMSSILQDIPVKSLNAVS